MEKNYTVEELVERMGEPKHIHSMEAGIGEHQFGPEFDINDPFTLNVIKDISIDKHGLKFLVNYLPLKGYIGQEAVIERTGEIKPTFRDSIPSTVNTIFWTSLENALSYVGGGSAGEVDEGNPTYSIDQCLGFDYKFDFFHKDLKHHGEVQLRITQNADYTGEILREDLIEALAKHWRKAI